MSQDDQATEKPFDPTPRKLQKARDKGEIVRSNDLNVAATYLGFILITLSFGPKAISQSGDLLSGFLANSDELADQHFARHTDDTLASLIPSFTNAFAPWFIGPAAAVILCLIVQKGFLFTPSKLQFKGSRIDPISNAKNKYGRSGLFEFLKSSTKLIIYCICLAAILAASMEEIINLQQLDTRLSLPIMMSLNLQLLTIVAAIALGIGAIDYLWQYSEHMRKNRMTRKEMTDEAKEAEGDPHLKQKRQAQAREVANSKMLSDVPNADVIVVNPTHYAVALKWNRSAKEAPRCVAKGTDEIAKRIRELAQENAIPIHSDPPTARMLFAEINVGDEIQTRHFEAVATAIRFADSMRRKRWR